MFISSIRFFFYTLTKALGQRFDIFSSPSPRFIVSLLPFKQSSCFSDSLFFFSLSLWLSHSLGCYLMLALLSTGHSGPVLVPSMQPTPPCSAPALCWLTEHLGYFSTRSCGQVCILWVVVVVVFSLRGYVVL